MDLELSGRRAVVIGGARGIGLAICKSLATEGCHVALCSRTAEQVDAAVSALQADGGSAEGSAVDMLDQASMIGWIDSVAADGGIDIAVLCPSAMGMGNEEADWQKSIDLDVMGSVRAIRALRPHLESSAARSGDAALTFISTVSVTEAGKTGAYGPAKAALVQHCKSLAKELAPKKLRVNVVTPGTVFIPGGGWDHVKNNAPDFFKAALARNPTGRMAEAREIADAVVFLSSPRSSFTTGANLVIDGALTHAVPSCRRQPGSA